jgi:hypothetical protein
MKKQQRTDMQWTWSRLAKGAWPVVFGVGIIGFGDGIYESGLAPMSGFPVYNWVGLLFMGAGLPFIGYGLYRLFRPGKSAEPNKVEHICPRCESVYALADDESRICPHDGTTLEPMKGYYQRHPEKRDKPVTPNRD